MSQSHSTTDSLGRSTFHSIAPRADVRLTARDVRWLKHIERHGPQNSQFLFELTQDTHRCKDTALRQMQKLRAGGYLRLPIQQRAIEKAEFNPYIYDLGNRARSDLIERGLAENTMRPKGHWWHSYAVSCVTSSIEIAAARCGVKYIPAHVILARNGAALEVPTKRGRVIPDQLFALDYGGRFRAFAVEVDRGTEPISSSSYRKSLTQSIARYASLIEDDLPRRHYGLNAKLLILWIFSSRVRRKNFLNLLERLPEGVCRTFLVFEEDMSVLHRNLQTQYFHGQWLRAVSSSVFLDG